MKKYFYLKPEYLIFGEEDEDRNQMVQSTLTVEFIKWPNDNQKEK